MISRERVITALNHKQPDKTPISLGSTIVDGLTSRAKDALEDYLGLPRTKYLITHKPMGTVETPKNLIERYELDFVTVRLKAPWNNPAHINPDGSYYDDYGCLMVPCEYYFDNMNRPLEGELEIEDILKKATWPDAYAPGRTDGLKMEAKALAASGKAVVADIMCGGPFEQALWLRGWEDFLCDLYTDPKLAEALLDKITEVDIGLWDVFLSEVGEHVDVVCQGDDLGMQDRSIISPEMYRKYIKKYHKRMYDFIKTKTKAKIFHHSCGSVHELLPDMIEAGIDILNPVQIRAANMEPERLKKDFGDSLTFWGGLDTQHMLPFGSVEEVEAQARHLIDVLGDGGGYVFAPGHNVQALVPPKNIDAMMMAAVKYR